MKAVVTRVQPDYPPMALQMRIRGRAVVEAVVDTEGHVEKAQPVSGNMILTAATVRAVRKWKFTPFTAEGKATRALVRVSVDFSLK